MYERFTDRARKVMQLANQEAQRFNHEYIGTEHVLLGLIKEGSGVAANVLKNLDIDLRKIRMEVEKLVQSGPDMVTMGKLPQTPRAKKVIEYSMEEARNLNHNYVGTEHILLGLLREQEGVAAQVLMNLGLKLEDVREEVLNLLGHGMEGEGGERAGLGGRATSGAGAGGAEGAIDASNVLKPALARGEIQCIGATTLDEYRKYIEKDSALDRRFQIIMIEPATKLEAVEILKGLRDRYESHHRVQISDAALESAVELSSRYITGRCLPDKAIDVIDEAGARVRLKAMTKPPDLKEIDEEVERLNKEKEEAVANQDFEKAAALRDQADKLKKKKQNMTRDWRDKSREADGVVDEEVVAEVVSKMTGIPLTRMSTEDSKRLMAMEDELHRRVIGQNEAIKSIAKAVRRSRSGLKDPKRPTGCFIFAGPTGVGKTLLAKALAQFMFGDADALIQIDMSEYMEKHNVSRLIGAPPGYVGFEEGGQLTEKIRRRPYSVVLLDELEKAHPDVFNMLLQVMEEGRLTDSFGRNVDFRNTILIMTTNAGAEAIKNESAFGFQKPDDDAGYDSMKKRVNERIEKFFRPEFLNRVDDVIVFHHLTVEDLKQVIDIELAKVRERLGERGLKLELTEAAKQFIIKKGSDTDFGARPLRRAIENYIEDPVSEELLKGEFIGKDTIQVDCIEVADKKQLKFIGVVTAEPVAALPAGDGEPKGE